MLSEQNRFSLSGNLLKVIAALAMLVDHVGYMFFPSCVALRIIGRLALPIFAFMIAEGCRYTRNKLRYFLTVFLLAFICQTVYFIYDGDTYMSILVTFSLSILLVYSFQMFKSDLDDKNSSVTKKLFSGIIFALSVGVVYLLNLILDIDYGFFGCMLPVFASLPYCANAEENSLAYFLDRPIIRVVTLSIGLVFLAIDSSGYQWYSLLALPLLLLYSGKRGRHKMKYFFYIFYPLHLLVLEGINMIL